MDNVVLKGRKDGYEIILKDTSSFDDIINDLKLLLQRLNQNESSSQKLSLIVSTGNRLLTTVQQTLVTRIINDYSHFTLNAINAEVLPKVVAEDDKWQGGIRVVSNVIRSGQVVNIEGDVLFLGTLHRGGTLQTTGSIFIFSGSTIEGIVHAGYPNDSGQVIAGNFANANQIRIGDTLEVIDTDTEKINDQSLAYVNDLHMLQHSTLSKLAEQKPKLLRQLEAR